MLLNPFKYTEYLLQTTCNIPIIFFSFAATTELEDNQLDILGQAVESHSNVYPHKTFAAKTELNSELLDNI